MADAKETPRNGKIREEDLRDIMSAVMDEEDKFYVSPEIIPDGFSVEWKRMTVLGKRTPDQNTYEMRLAKTRWEPVSLAAHPGFRRLVPKNYDGDTVENEGMILMIRPTEISKKVKQIQEYKARSQLNDKMAQLNQTVPGQAPRAVQVVRQSYEPPIEVPDKV